MTDTTTTPTTAPPAPPALKPGKFTTEFALAALAHALGWLLASGVIADGSLWARGIGAALAMLSALGYGAGRVALKRAIVLVLLLLTFAPQQACGPKTTAAVHSFTSCAEDAAAKELGPAVQSILTSGVSNWQAQLSALAASFGLDSLNCAVRAVEDVLRTKPTATADASAISRADEWLAQHGAGK